jgi:ubiquinone/menaquinone biosynthesis C-methylase UbiE
MGTAVSLPCVCPALVETKEENMSIRSRLFAATYDRQMRRVERAGLTGMRRRLVGEAAGDVLEIGGGTGANLAHYGGSVASLTITEPEAAMLKRLQTRVRAQAPEALVMRAPAEDLPFEDETFDTVVSTLVLCGVDDQPRSLREIRRVLRPEGRLLFLEHVRAADPALARRQDRMNWLNRAVVGCDCNRPTLDTIEQAGFYVTALEQTELPKAPAFVRPTTIGTAITHTPPSPPSISQSRQPDS